MTKLKLESRIQRLERQVRIRRWQDAVYEEIARREHEGRNRAEEWLRREQTEPGEAA